MSHYSGGSYGQLDHDEGAVEQLDYDGRAPEPYDPSMPRLRGGDSSYCPTGRTSTNGRSATAAKPAAYGRLSPPPNEEGTDDDFYEVPANEFYAARGLRGAPRQASPVAGRHARNGGGNFDFNDAEQPNPWQGAQPQQRRQPEHDRIRSPDVQPQVNVEVRRFAECHDRELRAYLSARCISFGFLAEIDQFFEGHPEIATCAEGRSTLHQLTVLPPLQAYKYFLKGYTRPARYIEGVVRTDAFTLPMDYVYRPLSTMRDPELMEFFDGFDYRHDIIERIDKEVYGGMQDLVNGRPITVGLRKLICYAVWGNPVDAYKWFEYSYQNEYMPHRYLPEHVVLGHVPKPANYAEPRPSGLKGYKKHRDVRARMARANDQGVDVLEVLIAEYRHALIRRAHRRVEIDKLVAKAKQRLDRERDEPTGVDIVDFIMDDAVSRQGTNTHRRRDAHSSYPRYHKTDNFGKVKITFNGNGGARIHGGTQRSTRTNARRGAGFLHAQAAELRYAKTNLLRLYTQEAHTITKSRGINPRDSTLQMVRASRATAERRYVNCLIRYCRDAGCMNAAEATRLQKDFTRERMGNFHSSNSAYLLGMYPWELY